MRIDISLRHAFWLNLWHCHDKRRMPFLRFVRNKCAAAGGFAGSVFFSRESDLPLAVIQFSYCVLADGKYLRKKKHLDVEYFFLLSNIICELDSDAGGGFA